MAEIAIQLEYLKINGKEIPFPDQNMSHLQAAKALSGEYPELTTANFDKTEDKGDKIFYVMSKGVGTHG